MLHELQAPCTCGMLYGSCGGGCSPLFAVSGDHLYKQCGAEEDEDGEGCYGGSVDCTLSLGTPSTRRAEAAVARVSGCNGKPDTGMARAEPSTPGGLPARRCANCDTTSTPLWRNGPRGPKSLCNACGIRYKKEERRAAATAVAAPALASDSGIGYVYGGYARQQQQQQPQWGCYGPAVAKAASFGMFGDVDAAVEDGPCLPWGLSVMPTSPSLFQYY